MELPSKGTTRALFLGFESEAWGRDFLKESAAERQAPCSGCGSGLTRSESTRGKNVLNCKLKILITLYRSSTSLSHWWRLGRRGPIYISPGQGGQSPRGSCFVREISNDDEDA